MADEPVAHRPQATVPRLRDVADHAGVHISTASRALDPMKASRISPVIVERVKAAAKALGYQQNVIAASLRRRQSRTVGVMVSDLTNPMFPPMFRGIEDRLHQIGYSALLTNSDFSLEREWQILDVFLRRQVDGLILATARLDDPIIRAALHRNIEVVLMNRSTETVNVPSILVDDALGIELVVAHLHDLGHRCIAHVAGPQGISTGLARREAFLAAAARRGLEPASTPVVQAAMFNEESGRRAVHELFESGAPATAVVCANDALALGAFDALAARGLACPGDVSVTGFNDMPFVDKLRPPLTSVRIPHYRMGYEAADELVRRLQHPDAPIVRRVLPPQLMVRESTAPPRA